jgi:hypothetical protein
MEIMNNDQEKPTESLSQALAPEEDTPIINPAVSPEMIGSNIANRVTISLPSNLSIDLISLQEPTGLLLESAVGFLQWYKDNYNGNNTTKQTSYT